MLNQYDDNHLKKGLWKINYKGSENCYCLANYYLDLKNGICFYFDEDGNIQQECNYKNDTLMGISINYFRHGKVFQIRYFINGFENGIRKTYSANTGELIEQLDMTQGVPNGKAFTYSQKESTRIESYYINGKENGWRKVYSTKGKDILLQEFYFENGERKRSKYYNKNGELTKEIIE